MDAFLGEIRMFAGSYVPQGWALCNGQQMPIQQNAALYSLLGVQFGGDGVTHFNLPNLIGRVPVSAGQGPDGVNYTVGLANGSPVMALTAANLPSHTHSVAVPCDNTGGASETSEPSKNYPALSTVGSIYSSAQNAAMASFPSGAAGDGSAFSVMQPCLCVNFIICLNGLYPTRQ